MATLPAFQPTVQLQNPLEGYLQVEQILGARQQREANALAMQQRQQALEAEEQIRRYQAGGGDPRGLLRFGAAGVQAFEQQIKGEKEFAELAASRFTMGRDLVLRASNPEALVNTVRSFFKDPVLGTTLTGLGQNVEGLTQYIVQNSSTPDGFDRVRLQLGQKAEDLGKSIQEMLSERQVAAALGGGAFGAPAGAPTAPAAPTAAAPAGTAVATPVAGTTAVPEVIDYASRWQQMVNAGIAAPALGERPAPAGAAPGGPTIQRLQSVVLPAPPSLNAIAPAAPVAPANALAAQAGGVVGAPAAGGIDISAIDPYAQRRDQLESRLQQTFNKDARAAIIAELNALPKPAAGVQEYLAYVRQEQAAGRRPVGIEKYKQNLARAGATNVESKVLAYVPASEQAQGDYIKAVSEERKALRNAADTLKNVEGAKALIPTASTFMGTGGQPLLAAASFLNNRLGFSIATQGVTDATVLRTRLFEGILDNLKKLDSQPSQEQQRVLSEALGNLGTDPAALPQILDRIAETMRDRVARYNQDVTDAERRGVKFPYKPQIDLPPIKPGPATIPSAASSAAPATAAVAARQVRRTGTLNGRRVIEYTDGSVEYAN